MLKELTVVVCSTSGKPVFHSVVSATAVAPTTCSSTEDEETSSTTSFVSSLQGLLSFVACTQQEELHELQSHGCRCVFYSTQTLTFAAIERDVHSDETNNTSSFSGTCLEHLLHLLQSQLRFLLSDQGLHVLQRQPNYDLRQRLHGTERVTRSLTGLWAVHPTLRFKDFGVPFVRLRLARRRQVTTMLAAAGEAETEPYLTSAMLCAVLLAKEKVVAIVQPKKKQFSMRVDDLLLLINFVYHTPSLAASETWTPICLPHFNARFLYAYMAFLTTDVCLLLLSSQPSPEQFPHFRAKKAFVARRLEDSGAMDEIRASVRNHSAWRPHRDLPLLLHFIYKNELTGECAEPALRFPFDDADCHTRLQLLNAYATVHQLMVPSPADPHRLRASQVLGERLLCSHDDTAARMVYERSDTGLFLGMCSTDYRLLVWFDSLVTISDARQQLQVVLDRIRHDEELMSIALFASSGGSSSADSFGTWL